MKFWNSALAIAALTLGTLSLSACKGKEVYIFEGVEGPAQPDSLFTLNPADPGDFNQGDENRLAVLLTTRQSNWLALTSGLMTIGIPFKLTEDFNEARFNCVRVSF